MRDAAWALLDEDGAMDRYTRIAWTTQEHWFSVLNLTMRAKHFKPSRLVCNIQEVDSAQPEGRKEFVAVLTVDGAEYIRGGSQKDRRTASEDAAQALMMDVAKLEEMLHMQPIPPQRYTQAASSPATRRGKGRRAKQGPTTGEVEGTRRTITLEKPWSTSSATESEEERGPRIGESVPGLKIAADEASKTLSASLKVLGNRKRGSVRGRKARKVDGAQ